ncbi:unnamed protein product [Gongylonema pulchrum]|uniref:PH domain-containing protein n=1 Tax=Gongylonema pulchrum TaxID=637853 RepID=A0A183D1T4_9BILA|nr:unnamed protein product [Gongylonema pulchrum]
MFLVPFRGVRKASTGKITLSLINVFLRFSNGNYICKDYSARRFVDIEPVEIDDPKLLQSVIAHIPMKKPHLFICTLMHNARGKQVELLLNADSETDRERWLSALRPPACSNPEEKIYADWDCPQALAVHQYCAEQEDELQLEKGDLINILRKMPDGIMNLKIFLIDLVPQFQVGSMVNEFVTGTVVGFRLLTFSRFIAWNYFLNFRTF